MCIRDSISINDEVLVSEKAWKMGGSKMFIEVGKRVSILDLLKGIFIQSGNDAAVAIAEYVGGTEDGFVDLMNAYAASLGMNNTSFINSTGLPDVNHLTTAEDLAILTSNFITKFPEIYALFKEKEFENSESRGDDIRVQTKEFLDVISKAIEGVVEEDLGEKDRIRAMVSRLLAVEIDEEEDSEDDEKNDCTRLAEFLEICINYENNNALALVFDKKEISQDPRITSHLLDPSVVGGPIFNQCLGSILMSGTLFPPEMYSEILGIPIERANCVEYPSGFPLGNRPVLIANDVTTKYTERRESMEGILEHIRSVIINTKGNVAIFAPSYSMLNEIHDHFDNSWTGKLILKEDQGMRKGTLQSIIDRLREQKNMRGAALFGVLSGKLSEGVDYPDNILNSLVCVGLPMPPPSARQDALIEYYTKKFDRSRAWKYASLQPAVNSILQALGRPIRKKEDRAIVVLLEKRLLGQRERNCFPEMQRMQTTSPTRTAERVKSFFQM